MNTFNLHDLELLKYPRTPHLEGSRLQTGDEGHFHVPYKTLTGKQIVIEEKLDGANCALRFDSYGQLFLQSRGHFLGGGGNERQFALLKKWASVHEPKLLEILTDRYIVFAEWLHKKHSVFYDSLPTYFAEFDIWDRHSNQWLDTKTRASILSSLPVLSVPVLYQGIAPKKLSDLVSFLAPSLGKSPNWKASFERTVIREKLELEKAWQLCDLNTLAEGLYIKVEENGSVVARYKWVRPDFVQTLISHNVHHSQQPYIANQLREGVDIFSPKLTENWSS